MRPLWIVVIAACATCASAAELDNNTVTVVAMQDAARPQQQLSVSVSLLTPVDVGLDQVLATLSDVGITASELSNVYSPYILPPDSGAITQWSFQHIIGFDRLKTTLTTLKALQAKLAPVMGSAPVAFHLSSYNGLGAPSCSYSSLLTDARRQADTIAAAAGLRTGAILSLSDGSSVDGAAPVNTPGFVVPNVWFGSALLGVIRTSVVPPAPNTCYLTVQFKLML